MKLEKTSNYELFQSNSEQRPIKEVHAHRIAENMKNVGFLPSKPIQCYRQGKALIVVDGHHRLEAAKSIKIPVYYVVEGADSQETMAAENMLVRKWTIEDFVRLYASRGIADYQVILSYAAHGIPVMMVASMLRNEGAGSGNVQRVIPSGHFRVKSTAKIDQVVRVIKMFNVMHPAVSSRQFIGALVDCLFCPEFSLDTLVTRIKEHPTTLTKSNNKGQMLAQLEAIYNFRSRNPFALKFNVEQLTRERQKFGGTGRTEKQ